MWDIQLVLQCEAGYEAPVSLGKHGEGARIVLEPRLLQCGGEERGAGVGVGRRFAPEARGLPLEHGGLLLMLTMQVGGLLLKARGLPCDTTWALMAEDRVKGHLVGPRMEG